MEKAVGASSAPRTPRHHHLHMDVPPDVGYRLSARARISGLRTPRPRPRPTGRRALVVDRVVGGRRPQHVGGSSRHLCGQRQCVGCRRQSTPTAIGCSATAVGHSRTRRTCRKFDFRRGRPKGEGREYITVGGSDARAPHHKRRAAARRGASSACCAQKRRPLRVQAIAVGDEGRASAAPRCRCSARASDMAYRLTCAPRGSTLQRAELALAAALLQRAGVDGRFMHAP